MKQTPEQWKLLLKAEQDAYDRCVNLDSECSDKSVEKSEALRQYWAIAYKVLRTFLKSCPSGTPTVHPLPFYCISRLIGVSENLSLGIVPSFVSDVGKGGRSLFPKERGDIAWALFYIDAVARKDITDRSPIATVGECYGVARQSVQRWKKERAAICEGLETRGRWNPIMIERNMRAAGKSYQRLGRGATEYESD